MTFNEHHVEKITFFEYCSQTQPIILGYPWLRLHNPQIDWLTEDITFESEFCLMNCLGSQRESALVGPVQIESEFPDLSKMATCYHDLKEVFNKTKATSLLTHRPYDCTIDLAHLLPRDIYIPLAMKEYIQSSLKAGIIRPASSPARGGFFFVSKKDNSLLPCIDY